MIDHIQRTEESQPNTIKAKILQLLSDGAPHHRDELRNIVKPSSPTMVIKHVSAMRNQLRARGEDIICVLRNRQIHYQHVRLLRGSSPDMGRDV